MAINQFSKTSTNILFYVYTLFTAIILVGLQQNCIYLFQSLYKDNNLIVFIFKHSDLMFASSPFSSLVPPSNSESHLLISAIKDQTDGIPPHLVYVIDIVSVKFGGYFTAQVRNQLQKYQYLQMLTLNDCGIVSLQNFPHLPALIRLDLVFNSIPGQSLQFIKGSRHLQTIMLGANKVQKLQHLSALKNFKQLLQLDLINNPVSKLPGYRVQVFALFSSLTILDTLDKSGKDAYSNTTMVQAVSRIPDNLFDKTKPLILPPLVHPVHAPVHKKQTSKLKKALARTGSLDSMSGVAPKVRSGPDRSAVRGKLGKAGKLPLGSGSRSKSSRAGLVFPVGRIKRKLKQVMVGQRVGGSSAVYLAGVLQYLAAQLIQISGNIAKNQKKTRITPQMIKNSLKTDAQMKQLLQNVTIGMMSE